jgi:hypothetical protein
MRPAGTVQKHHRRAASAAQNLYFTARDRNPL